MAGLQSLETELAKHDLWYHTMELPGGYRTPGVFDMRRALDRVPLAASLAGQRCLDVGTADGFWAFEMEQRGAAEVVGFDVDEWGELDWPPAEPPGPTHLGRPVSTRFHLAREALGSQVEWTGGSVYDLSRERYGSFDVVFVGSMLLHLRDPVRALAAVRSVTSGELVVNEAVADALVPLGSRYPAAKLVGRGGPVWWVANPAGLARMAEAAGFEVVKVGRPYYLRYGPGRAVSSGHALTPISLRPLRGLPLSLARNVRDRLGVLHVSLSARPRLVAA